MTRADWMLVEREFNRREPEEPAMGFGKWSRWGRGSCEGYTLEFGFALRFDIRPRNHDALGRPQTWSAGARMGSLGDHPTFLDAAIACEAEARRIVESALASNDSGRDIAMVVDDWKKFTALPEKQRRRQPGSRRR